MSKKRTVSINTDVVVKQETVVPDSISAVNPLEQLNRYLPPHVKYTFDEFISKFPEKAERIVTHANISDEALLGYIKTLVVIPQELTPVETIPEQTEE